MNRGLLILLMAGMSAISPFAIQCLPPTAPFIRQDFDVSLATAQWSVSLFTLTLAFAMLAYGPLTDRFNRKTLLLTGLSLFSAGSALSAVAPNIELLIFARILQGIGAAAGSVIARAFAAQWFKAEELAEVYGYVNMAIVIAPMFAPLTVGVAIDAVGWRAAMWVMCVIGVVMIAVMTYIMRPGGSAAQTMGRVTAQPVSPLQALSHLITRAPFMMYLMMSAVMQIGMFAFMAGAPFILVDMLGRPASEYGLYFISLTVFYFLGSWFSARYASRIGMDRLIALGVTLFLVGVFGLFLLIWVNILEPVFIFGMACLCAAANGLTQPNTSAGAMTHAGDYAGSASSLVAFTLVMFGGFGLQLVGFLQNDTAYPMVAVMAAAGCVGLSIALTLVIRSSRA